MSGGTALGEQEELVEVEPVEIEPDKLEPEGITPSTESLQPAPLSVEPTMEDFVSALEAIILTPEIKVEIAQFKEEYPEAAAEAQKIGEDAAKELIQQAREAGLLDTETSSSAINRVGPPTQKEFEALHGFSEPGISSPDVINPQAQELQPVQLEAPKKEGPKKEAGKIDSVKKAGGLEALKESAGPVVAGVAKLKDDLKKLFGLEATKVDAPKIPLRDRLYTFADKALNVVLDGLVSGLGAKRKGNQELAAMLPKEQKSETLKTEAVKNAREVWNKVGNRASATEVIRLNMEPNFRLLVAAGSKVAGMMGLVGTYLALKSASIATKIGTTVLVQGARGNLGEWGVKLATPVVRKVLEQGKVPIEERPLSKAQPHIKLNKS